MKKNFLITVALLCSQLITGQTQPFNNTNDPFCKMVDTIFRIDSLSFNAQYTTKRLFETDTITSFARILFRKKGTLLHYLRITPTNGQKELLFYRDSSWVADHDSKKIICIGTSLDDLNGNSMAQYFSFSFFKIDTLIFQAEPSWNITDRTLDLTTVSIPLTRTLDLTTVSIPLTNNSPELSDVSLEISIRNSDHLLVGTRQEYNYLKVDKSFQEQLFSDYIFPGHDELEIPAYFTHYQKDLSYFNRADPQETDSAGIAKQEVFLDHIELYDLSGEFYLLPEDGLLFLDLWYVGCSPCMKSAPVIEKIYHQFQDRVYFYSINEVDQDNVKIMNFCKKMGLTMPVLIGEKYKLSGAVTGAGGYPVFILVDAETRQVLWYLRGFAENLEDLIREAISSNL